MKVVNGCSPRGISCDSQDRDVLEGDECLLLVIFLCYSSEAEIEVNRRSRKSVFRGYFLSHR